MVQPRGCFIQGLWIELAGGYHDALERRGDVRVYHPGEHCLGVEQLRRPPTLLLERSMSELEGRKYLPLV